MAGASWTSRRSRWRLDQRTYDQLRSLEKIDKPTDADLNSLEELLDEILSDAP